MKKLLISCLAIAALSMNAALGADLVDVKGIPQNYSGGKYHTQLTLVTKFAGPATFKANNRAVASPDSMTVRRNQRITIRVVSPQRSNTLTVRDVNRGQTDQVKW